MWRARSSAWSSRSFHLPWLECDTPSSRSACDRPLLRLRNGVGVLLRCCSSTFGERLLRNRCRNLNPPTTEDFRRPPSSTPPPPPPRRSPLSFVVSFADSTSSTSSSSEQPVLSTWYFVGDCLGPPCMELGVGKVVSGCGGCGGGLTTADVLLVVGSCSGRSGSTLGGCGATEAATVAVELRVDCCSRVAGATSRTGVFSTDNTRSSQARPWPPYCSRRCTSPNDREPGVVAASGCRADS